MRLPLILIALAVAPVPGEAAETALACSPSTALPADLTGWTVRTPLRAATATASAAQAELTVGRSSLVTLAPTRTVAYALQPEKPGGSVSHRGLVAITIATPGAYRVTLDTAAWIDVVEDGAFVVSKAHGHGPECSTMRKVVAFDLKAGRHIIQVSANAQPTIQLMVTRSP